MHYDTSLYSAGCKEKIDEDAKINLQEPNFLSKISTPFPTFLIPFFIIKAEFWQLISSEFLNPA